MTAPNGAAAGHARKGNGCWWRDSKRDRHPRSTRHRNSARGSNRVGSLCQAISKQRPSDGSSIALGSIKANAAHAEPSAGMSGLALLLSKVEGRRQFPNAHLRVMNRHVRAAFRGVSCALPVTSLRDLSVRAGGVNSFGYNGTIAHALLGYVDEVCHPRSRQVYRRRCFPWSDKAEPDKAADSGIAFYATGWEVKAASTTFDPPPTSRESGLLVIQQFSAVSQSASQGAASSRLALKRPKTLLVPLCSEVSASPSHDSAMLLLRLAQVAGSLRPSPHLVLVTSGTQAADPMRAASNGVAHGITWGFTRVLRLEQRNVPAQSVDIACQRDGRRYADAFGALLTRVEHHESEQAWSGSGAAHVLRIHRVRALRKAPSRKVPRYLIA